MPARRRRKLGARILKAVSSNLRLNILKLLFDKGPLSYTEIMNQLKLSPSKDAGRFAYHLKVLLNMDLIEPDVESKKYLLTDLGKSVVDFASSLEERTFKRRMLVRTSRLAIERFDRNKIAESLIKEAGVPIDLAQRIARETEERLLKLDTKYLTAPLIREFVNTILIERGLEEYRHKLTRLGLPVYDVTQLIKAMSQSSADVETVRMVAGNHVIEEYALINTLPRDVADSHLSGALNLDDLAYWILKLNSFMHDPRYFFKHGLTLGEGSSGNIPIFPPKSFRAALHLMVNALKIASAEVSCEQGIGFFNIFLAPFIKNLSEEEIRENLNYFISSINLTVPTGVSLGIEAEIPGFIAESRAIGPGGESVGVYGDYVDEAHILASLITDSLSIMSKPKPVFNPSLIIKFSPRTFRNSEGETLLYKAHELAVYGLPYFATPPSRRKEVSYLATGHMFSADWRRDWELDTVRVGCMGSVTINLPRAFYESKNKESFFENLYDFSEKALRALEIKYRTIRQRAYEGLLPFLTQGAKIDSYCRLDNSLFLLSPAGLNETVQLATKNSIYKSSKSLRFAEEIFSYLQKIVEGYSNRRGMRCAISLTPNPEALKRMAVLDIEHYGFARVKVSGGRENPYYSGLESIPSDPEIPIERYLSIEEKLHRFPLGSRLTKIAINEKRADPEQLFSMTKKIVSNFKIPLYTYNTTITYCSSCRKTFHGNQLKCPSCGSVNTITKFTRKNTRYEIIRQ